MGYKISIGELRGSIIGEGTASYLQYEVAKILSPIDVPYFSEDTYSNIITPSYLQWADAMVSVGLSDFMFNNKTGLIREYEGLIPLTLEHKEIIDKAYKQFLVNNTKNHPHFQILEWLKYWVDWALINCTIPIFKYS